MRAESKRPRHAITVIALEVSSFSRVEIDQRSMIGGRRSARLRTLVLEPKLLILDAPTEGIQPNMVHEIGDIVLSEFCILDKGRRVAAGPIGELTGQVVRAHLSVRRPPLPDGRGSEAPSEPRP